VSPRNLPIPSLRKELASKTSTTGEFLYKLNCSGMATEPEMIRFFWIFANFPEMRGKRLNAHSISIGRSIISLGASRLRKDSTLISEKLE